MSDRDKQGRQIVLSPGYVVCPYIKSGALHWAYMESMQNGASVCLCIPELAWVRIRVGRKGSSAGCTRGEGQGCCGLMPWGRAGGPWCMCTAGMLPERPKCNFATQHAAQDSAAQM